MSWELVNLGHLDNVNQKKKTFSVITVRGFHFVSSYTIYLKASTSRLSCINSHIRWFLPLFYNWIEPLITILMTKKGERNLWGLGTKQQVN